jgi:hypothetical protein
MEQRENTEGSKLGMSTRSKERRIIKDKEYEKKKALNKANLP